MSAQGADAGELHAGGAGAYDKDALGVLALYLGGELALGIPQRRLAVALVVAYAADLLAGLGGVEAEGVAADAGADAVIFAAHRLVHELGIGQPLTADDDAVKVAALDDLLGEGDVLAHAHDDGSLHAGLDVAAEVVPVAEGDLHGDEGHGGVVPAGGDGEAVHEAGLVEVLADVGDVVAGAAALEQVAAAHAQLQGIVGADGGADGGQGLDHEAVAVLHVLAAVLVLALVGQRGPELAVEVAGVGLELDAVKAGLLGDDRGLGLPLDELVYLVYGQGAGHLIVGELARHGGGAHGLLAVYGGARRGGAAVHYLGKDLGAALVDGAGDGLEGGDVLLIGEQGNVVRVAHLVPLHVGENYEADSALRPGAVEIGGRRVKDAVDAVAHAHGGHHYAVLELQAVDLHRCVKLLHWSLSLYIQNW